MLHTSTDYVFSGEATHAWDEGDVALPMCAYGLSKRAGELAVQASCSRGYIVRLSGLYGTRGSRAKSGGGNFVETMLKLQAAGRPIRVVDDQILAPTSTLDVARKMRELIEAGAPYGVYHMTAAGECSWYEFARGIFQLARLDVDLTPQHTSDVVQRARRPRYSVLANNALHRVGIGHIRPWIEGLEEYLRRRRGSGLLATSAAA
jgi:dTDP-4-dehydrorhamnose reductase